jgi:hypothetical protein
MREIRGIIFVLAQQPDNENSYLITFANTNSNNPMIITIPINDAIPCHPKKLILLSLHHTKKYPRNYIIRLMAH